MNHPATPIGVPAETLELTQRRQAMYAKRNPCHGPPVLKLPIIDITVTTVVRHVTSWKFGGSHRALVIRGFHVQERFTRAFGDYQIRRLKVALQ